MPLGADYKLVDPTAQPDPESEEGALVAGTYKTINAAIQDGGGTIVIKPGIYEETLLLEEGERLIGLRKAKEILEDAGSDLPDIPGDTIIRGTSFHTVSFLGKGELVGITVQQYGPGQWFAVLCAGEGAAAEITDCDIDSATNSCLGISEGAGPTIKQCKIHGSKTGSGVAVFAGGKGTIQESEIYENAMSGVEALDEETEITLTGNTIRANRADGVLVAEQAKATLEENKIFRNFHSGVEVREKANVTANKNEISSNNFGVIVAKESVCTMAENKINKNYITGLEISHSNTDEEEPKSEVQNNEISFNLESGIKVWYSGAVNLAGNTSIANLSETKLSPRSRRHVNLGEPEEGQPKGAYGTNNIKELMQILYPPVIPEDPTLGGQEAEEKTEES